MLPRLRAREDAGVKPHLMRLEGYLRDGAHRAPREGRVLPLRDIRVEA